MANAVRSQKLTERKVDSANAQCEASVIFD